MVRFPGCRRETANKSLRAKILASEKVIELIKGVS